MYVGEKNHTQVIINCVSIFSNYPNAVATMVVKPPVGDLYPVILTRNGMVVVWDVTESDIAYSGSGQFQLTFTDGSGDSAEIIKTVYGQYSIKPSLASTGEPPEPIEDWLQEANEALSEIRYITDISASATTLSPDAPATAEINNVDGHLNIAVGIPKGEKGDQGDPAPAEEITEAVDEYLAENFSNPSNPPLDRSLSSSLSAAPADMVGDLKSALNKLDETVLNRNNILQKAVLTENEFYSTSAHSNSSYSYFIFPVTSGQKYIIYTSARFISKPGVVLYESTSANYEYTADFTGDLIVTFNNSDRDNWRVFLKGTSVDDVPAYDDEEINGMKELEEELGQEINAVELKVDNLKKSVVNMNNLMQGASWAENEYYNTSAHSDNNYSYFVIPVSQTKGMKRAYTHFCNTIPQRFS